LFLSAIWPLIVYPEMRRKLPGEGSRENEEREKRRGLLIERGMGKVFKF